MDNSSSFAPWAPFLRSARDWWMQNHATPWSRDMPSWAPYANAAQPPTPASAAPGAPPVWSTFGMSGPGLTKFSPSGTALGTAQAYMQNPPPAYDPTGGIGSGGPTPLPRPRPAMMPPPASPPGAAMAQAGSAPAQPQGFGPFSGTGLFNTFGGDIGGLLDRFIPGRGSAFGKLGGDLGSGADWLVGTTTGPSLISKFMDYYHGRQPAAAVDGPDQSGRNI